MLKGEKVLLRPMIRDDIARQHQFDQDPELYVLDGAEPRPAPIEAAERFYDNRTRADDHMAPFAIEADGVYIGSCELSGLQDRHRSLSIGIQIGDRAYWGRGYGRDAVRVLLRYGFELCGARRIVLTTHAKNERAIRCYRACGFIEEGRPRKAAWIAGEYTDLVNMSILRDEWEQHRGYPDAANA